MFFEITDSMLKKQTNYWKQQTYTSCFNIFIAKQY